MKFTEGIYRYVMRKRSEGIVFLKGESYLIGLSRYVGDVQLSQVKSQHVLTFLNDSVAATAVWRMKYYVLQNFFDFWAARGAMSELLMPPIRPRERQTYLPHVYSRAELRALLKATMKNRQSNISVDRPTMCTLILLLYGTGARSGEILNLLIEDVDIERGNILITNKNRNRCRQIPIGADLRDVLRKYLAWRVKKSFQNQMLFVTKIGMPITVDLASKNFRRLRTIANVTRDHAASYQPCLQDLQCTFAVHRITSWIRNGVDMNRMLPALAAYMGRVGLNSTERFLHMTPERFKKNLNRLSPKGQRKHWRNDKKLMEFLATL